VHTKAGWASENSIPAEALRRATSRYERAESCKCPEGRNIKPSCMEQATEPKPPGSSSDRRRGRASTRSKLSIHEERTVKVAAHQTPMSESFTV
jgi:hypothetical protein